MESDDHRAIGATTFNHCWELLDQPERTAAEDAELLTAAFASRFHWSYAGGPEQWILADWMVSRAAAAVGEGRLALTFAERARDEALQTEAADWLLASVTEGVARAHAALGDRAAVAEWCRTAQELVARIADEEERALIERQLATVPRP